MNALLLFTLLCPDTVFFQEPFPIRIQPPIEADSLTAWEARSGDAGIVGQGFVPPGADSVMVRIEGPADYFGDGSKFSIQAGPYDSKYGQIRPVPGVSCMAVIKVRPMTGTRPGSGLQPVPGKRNWHGFRLDGRFMGGWYSHE